MIGWIASSSVLILVIIALRYALRGKVSLRLQYALWGLVLLRLLLPFSIGSSSLSLMNAVETAPIVREIESVRNVDFIEHMDDGSIRGATYPIPSSQTQTDWIYTPVAEQATEEEFSQLERVIDLRDALKILWLCGTVVLLAALILSNLRFYLRLRRSRCPLECPGSPLPVYVTTEANTPCLFGLVKPVIYVTPEAAADPTVLRHTMAHELTHRRHGDHIWSALRGLCLAVHWYNPLVWWAAFLSRSDAELACDESTLRRIGESARAEYGRTLIRMTCQKPTDFLVAATTMTGSKRTIKERIALIAKRPKMALYTLIVVLIIAAVAAGCTFTGAREDGKTGGDGGTAITLELSDGAQVPDAVVDYAREYVAERIAFFKALTITEAKITGLTDMNTGTVGLNNGYFLYLLEYRLKYADAPVDFAPDAVTVEDGWITERENGSQPFLLMFSEFSGLDSSWEPRQNTEHTWTPICVLYTEDFEPYSGLGSPDQFIPVIMERGDEYRKQLAPERTGIITVGPATQNIYKALSAEDSEQIAYRLVWGFWGTAIPDCGPDYRLTAGERQLSYHSECGTFYDADRGRSLTLAEESRAVVNEILRQHSMPQENEADMLKVLEAMAAVKAEDFTGFTGTMGNVELAQALNRAADRLPDPADPAQFTYGYWSVTAYLDEKSDHVDYNGLRFELACAMEESLVEVTLWSGRKSDTAIVEDEELYWLVRRARDGSEGVNQAAYEPFRDIMAAYMEQELADNSDNPGQFTGCELVYFAPIWSYTDDGDGSTVQIFDFDVALTASDLPHLAPYGGMYIDSQLRVRGGNTNSLAVRYRDGQVTATAFVWKSYDGKGNIDASMINAALDEAEAP